MLLQVDITSLFIRTIQFYFIQTIIFILDLKQKSALN